MLVGESAFVLGWGMAEVGGAFYHYSCKRVLTGELVHGGVCGKEERRRNGMRGGKLVAEQHTIYVGWLREIYGG